jgi:hypothetical protein
LSNISQNIGPLDLNYERNAFGELPFFPNKKKQCNCL